MRDQERKKNGEREKQKVEKRYYLECTEGKKRILSMERRKGG